MNWWSSTSATRIGLDRGRVPGGSYVDVLFTLIRELRLRLRVYAEIAHSGGAVPRAADSERGQELSGG